MVVLCFVAEHEPLEVGTFMWSIQRKSMQQKSKLSTELYFNNYKKKTHIHIHHCRKNT